MNKKLQNFIFDKRFILMQSNSLTDFFYFSRKLVDGFWPCRINRLSAKDKVVPVVEYVPHTYAIYAKFGTVMYLWERVRFWQSITPLILSHGPKFGGLTAILLDLKQAKFAR